MKRQRKSEGYTAEDGFTLLELLVVLGIIALLSALVAPQVIRYLSDARSSAATAQIKNLESAVELYNLDTGTYPPADQGLQSLMVQPPNVGGWKGPYLKKDSGVVDPWGKPFAYKFPGEHGKFDIATFGRDGKQGGEGEDRDLVSW
jgi:general secretion pathway protein G